MFRTGQKPMCRAVTWIRGCGPILLLASGIGCGGGNVPLPDLSGALVDTAGLAERGEYLVRNAAVCGHCHAEDPQRDPDGPLSGGMTFRNWRLGAIRAANLTPDSATGLGRWSEEEIVRAIRTGEDREGHVLAPVMPYEWFHGMSDRDALAVARYLKSLPPVRKEVDNDPNLIYRAARLFFLGPKDPPQDQAPPRGPTAEYGEYLALHVSLCADCHTPRGGIRSTPDRDRLFAGTASPPGGFPANPSNLTPDPETGIGNWSEEDFLRTIRTGVNPEGDSLHAFMPWREYRRMTDDDLRAIYRYLRTLKPIRNEVPRREED
ncbi:MAG TPA: cytochrome c [Longimicrobiaceae bacterium]